MCSTVNNLKDKKRLTINHLFLSPLQEEFKAISQDLEITNPRQILFHYENQLNCIPCCKCGNPLQWHADERAYRKYCCKRCTARYSVADKKQNNLKLYGVEWHSQLPTWREKSIQTSIDRYGSEHYSKTDAFKQSTKITNLEKYGVEHVMHLSETKKKIQETCLDKYKVDNPAKDKGVQKKIQTTNLEKYNVACVFQNKDVKKQIENTNLKKYGVKNASQNKQIRQKIVSARQKNYYSESVLQLIKDKEWLSTENSSGKTVAEIAKQLDVSASNLGKIYHKHGLDIVRHQHSAEENVIYDQFCKDYEIVRNTRDVIPPKETDLFFKKHNLAVEINGIYFHSEKFSKQKNYHLDKTLEAEKRNIALIHFWDFEVNNKLSIVTSIINNKLGSIQHKLDARKTSIVGIDKKHKKQFLDTNHLQGNCSSSIDLGLCYQGELVAVACFSRNRFSKKADYELVRLCSKINYNIRGAAGKLLKHFVTKHMAAGEKLVSYADRRYSEGMVYKKLGFDFDSNSPPGFFYVDRQGNYAGSRHKWQKHLLEQKLPNFNPQLSAELNMKNNSFYRVWDCGQSVYIFTK